MAIQHHPTQTTRPPHLPNPPTSRSLLLPFILPLTLLNLPLLLPTTTAFDVRSKQNSALHLKRDYYTVPQGHDPASPWVIRTLDIAIILSIAGLVGVSIWACVLRPWLKKRDIKKQQQLMGGGGRVWVGNGGGGGGDGGFVGGNGGHGGFVGGGGGGNATGMGFGTGPAPSPRNTGGFVHGPAPPAHVANGEPPMGEGGGKEGGAWRWA